VNNVDNFSSLTLTKIFNKIFENKYRWSEKGREPQIPCFYERTVSRLFLPFPWTRTKPPIESRPLRTFYKAVGVLGLTNQITKEVKWSM